MESKRMHWLATAGATTVALLLGAAVFGDQGVIRNERLNEELRRLNALNAELTENNRQLRKEIDALRHDPNYVESVIRDELGWVRNDELVFIVPNADSEGGGGL